MEKSTQRMSFRGAGLLRLWAELQIYQGGLVPAVQLVSAARSHASAPIQVTVPRSIVLGLKNYSPEEEARLFSYFGVTVEDVERIGNGEHQVLRDVVAGWAA